ncbi:Imm45 family immunity protein [Volucribacter amazonae]|uniref:Immunity protein 45 domain-containing protein n=1 Tax=Volucribacter amazonae TaxID=256731 RepID=A0A9X4PB71_9PAST|nr:Imm45 family immunity protein [Volucribacter amazonae]MDG6894346.1 hypothetical protein [Volucribacter amazonae]
MKLINYPYNLKHGNILKVPNLVKGESFTEMMLSQTYHEKGKFSFIVISGKKSGKILFEIPNEAEIEKSTAIKTKWVIDYLENSYPEKDIKLIYIRKGIFLRKMKNKSDYKKLSNYKKSHISYGSIIRFSASYPYEQNIEVILSEFDKKEKELCFLILSGRRAGLILVIPPEDSLVYHEGILGISIKWLSYNWNYWVYQDCDFHKIIIKQTRYIKK